MQHHLVGPIAQALYDGDPGYTVMQSTTEIITANSFLSAGHNSR